jgi:glutathionylspermidine synthase
VFQILWPLPKFNDGKIQRCTFAAGDFYAGASVHTATSIMIATQSDLLILRVVDNDKARRSATVNSQMLIV